MKIDLPPVFVQKKSDFVIGINVLLVPIFWGHFYFDPYISILPHLIPKMKNAFYFSLYCHSLNKNC